MKISMQHISKSFGSNVVLKDVNFEIQGGEVHALMGENGAGKSTMMNILTGLLTPNGGQILVDDVPTRFKSALEAEEHGISFIHQEMNNFAEMPVLDNMFLNKELKTRFGLIDNAKMEALASEALQRLGITVDLKAPIGSLSVGQQQMIEIAKSLMTDAQIIIMDEPTAALTEKEIRKLFGAIQQLRSQGVGLIYISHRMEELFEIADRVTVMRDGLTINTYRTADTTVKQIVRDMVGRDMGDFYPERTPQLGEPRLTVSHLTREPAFRDITFTVRSGEVLAFSGLMGAGRTEIMRAIFGIDKGASGKIEINGQKVTIRNPNEAIHQHIGFLTEDRKTEGLILDDTIANNIDLPSIDGFVKRGLIDQKADRAFVEMLMKRLTVRATGPDAEAGSLSGGNQQKVVLAKWVGSGSQVLILDEPTRGVDVGAKREIYDLMNELTDRGTAIIMISSDLDEVLGFSDNIAVVYEGQLMGIVPTKDATQESIMTLATGGEANE